MQIIIKGRQLQVTPQLRQRIERKIQRLTRLTDEDARVFHEPPLCAFLWSFGLFFLGC